MDIELEAAALQAEADEKIAERDKNLALRDALGKAPPADDADTRERGEAIRYFDDLATQAGEAAEKARRASHALSLLVPAGVETT